MCCVISRRRTNISTGTEVGKARGSLRSNPKEKEGKSLVCPCQVNIDLVGHALFFVYFFRQVLGSFMKMVGRMKKQFPSLNVKIKYKCIGDSWLSNKPNKDTFFMKLFLIMAVIFGIEHFK